MNILVTGGAGFIGSAVCRRLVEAGQDKVVNVDKLTYAANLQSLRDIQTHHNYKFYQTDISDGSKIGEILRTHKIEAVMHLAAESHVDRSIAAPAEFMQTNVMGTFQLLEAVTLYWNELTSARHKSFRFHHVSTDEVFGALPLDKGIFDEDSPYLPSSPYAASKAAADHMVRAWNVTYGLPTIVSNCSNNYGPFQFPEKLIPLVILNALSGKKLPIFGDGLNVRDWLFVDDHAAALETIIRHGRVGQNYNVGGNSQHSNKTVVEAICNLLDELRPSEGAQKYRELIEYVPDRAGHDRRYAIKSAKIEAELNWQPVESFETGLRRTVIWYLDNEWWWQPLHQRHKTGKV